MADKPPPKDVHDEPGAEDRFAQGVANALRMRPKPHKDDPKKLRTPRKP